MAYFRGVTYIWSDGDELHFWSRNGMDGWNNTVWSCHEDETLRDGFENASGVSLPEAVVDKLVMMRVAELLAHRTPEEIEKLMDEAVAVGNFGSNCLKKNVSALKTAFGTLKLKNPDR